MSSLPPANEPENGPPPSKTTKKRNNGANILNEEYQSDYDQRAKQDIDRVKAVNEHNKYPQLDEELQKKISIIKVTTIRSSRVAYPYDLSCPACAKLMTIRELKRQRIRTRCTQRVPRIKEYHHRSKETGKRKEKYKPYRRAFTFKRLRDKCGKFMKCKPQGIGRVASSRTSYISFLSVDDQPMV